MNKLDRKIKRYKRILVVITIVAVMLTALLYTINHPVSERVETEPMEVVIIETSFARWTPGNVSYLNHSMGFENDTVLNIYYIEGSRLKPERLRTNSVEVHIGMNLSLVKVNTYKVNLFGQWISMEASYIVTIPEINTTKVMA